MAALIRRLGGSAFRRTQARLMHTQLQPARATRPTQDVQVLKERLYESLSKTEQDPRTSNWRNSLLIQHLAGHVKPRPHDNLWRGLRLSGRANSFVHATGMTGIFLFNSLIAAIYIKHGKEGLKRALGNADEQSE